MPSSPAFGVEAFTIVGRTRRINRPSGPQRTQVGDRRRLANERHVLHDDPRIPHAVRPVGRHRRPTRRSGSPRSLRTPRRPGDRAGRAPARSRSRRSTGTAPAWPRGVRGAHRRTSDPSGGSWCRTPAPRARRWSPDRTRDDRRARSPRRPPRVPRTRTRRADRSDSCAFTSGMYGSQNRTSAPLARNGRPRAPTGSHASRSSPSCTPDRAAAPGSR